MKVTHAIEGTTPKSNFLEDTRRSAEFEPESNFLEDPRGSTKIRGKSSRSQNSRIFLEFEENWTHWLQEILSFLSILSIENERARKLNLHEIVKQFAEKKAGRRGCSD